MSRGFQSAVCGARHCGHPIALEAESGSAKKPVSKIESKRSNGLNARIVPEAVTWGCSCSDQKKTRDSVVREVKLDAKMPNICRSVGRRMNTLDEVATVFLTQGGVETFDNGTGTSGRKRRALDRERRELE